MTDRHPEQDINPAYPSPDSMPPEHRKPEWEEAIRAWAKANEAWDRTIRVQKKIGFLIIVLFWFVLTLVGGMSGFLLYLLYYFK